MILLKTTTSLFVFTEGIHLPLGHVLVLEDKALPQQGSQ